MDYQAIKKAAEGYKDDMTAFLRAIVKNPGESCDEKAHIQTIADEMKKVGFDKVEIDPMGNVLGYMGTGRKLIGFDAHIDTVGIGNRDMKPKKKSAAAEPPTSSAVSSLQYTARRS